MKKTLVALAVLASAGSAQAIEIYNQDRATVNLTGDVEVVYLRDTAENASTQQEIQDADFGFDVRYAVNDDLQVGGYWEFSGDNAGAAEAGNVYVGFYSAMAGSLKIGRLDTVLDDAGIGNDYQFGTAGFFQNGSKFGLDEAIRYDVDKGTWYVSAALAQDKNDSTAVIGEDGYWFDGKAGFRVADFDFTGFLGKLKRDTGTVEADENLYALEARYNGFENIGLAAGYYNVKGDIVNPGTDVKGDAIALDATYSLDAWKFAVGYTRLDGDDQEAENTYYLNAGYGIAPSTTVYAELGGTDADNSQLGFAIGMKSEF
ncbi:porin [Vibrio maritimus]|uniref:porin n=1 Tax=Vibrio maritimus TaxID=990268 RepID=UPI001F485213|nr:porin [Vibrio maritimus]